MRSCKKLALLAVSIVGMTIILTSCGGAGGGVPGNPAEEHPSVPDSSSSSSVPSESTSSSTSQPDDEKPYEATWSTGADGIPVLTKYTVHGELPTGDLVLPDEGTYKIGERLFAQNQQITSVTIPEGVVGIGNSAFTGCKNLTKVSLPSGLKDMGYSAFSQTGITEIKIPEGITTITSSVFYECENLSNVVFPSTLKTIGNSAFWGTKLERISLPEGLLNIEDNAFYGTKLTEIIVPEGVISIGDFAFSGKLFSEESSPSVEKIVLPSTLKTIGYMAFGDCSKVTEISLPDGLEEIGTAVFENMRIVTLRIPQSVKMIGDRAFSGNKYLASVTIEGPAKLGKNVFWDCSKLKDVKLNEGITEIPEGTFSYCMALNQIELPTELKMIGDSAFAETSLTSIKIPSKVTSIGENAFKHAKFEALVLPDGISEISFEGLAYCFNLKKLYIPANVKKINRGAFEGCNNLTDIYYAGSESMWDNISIDATGNDVLSNATVHPNSSSAMMELSSLFF